MHEARWIKKANHILRLYVTQSNPSYPLHRMCVVILQLYAPFFFKIKTSWHIKDGARNFHFAVKLARDCLIDEERDVTENTFRNNSYFAHIEAILLSAICDPDLTARQWAVRIILKCRSSRSDSVRHFILPKNELNLGAKTYLTLLKIIPLQNLHCFLTLLMTN